MRFIFILSVSLWTVTAASSRSWSPDIYPNPTRDIASCGRGVPSWICDPDGIVSHEAANVVEGIIKNIYAGEKPYALGPCGNDELKGYQVAVALMKKMRTSSDPAKEAKEFARALHDGWGVGDKECNNGVLLFLSVEDRQLYISTGSGTIRRLTSDVLGHIIDDVRPSLTGKDYDTAVQQAVIEIGLALAGREDRRRNWDDVIGLAIFCSVVGGIMLWSARVESRKIRRYQDCKSKLEKLKRDQAAIRANTYNPTSCPVCLEDFTTTPPTPTDPLATSAVATETKEAPGTTAKDAGPNISSPQSANAGGAAAAQPACCTAAAVGPSSHPVPGGAARLGGSSGRSALAEEEDDVRRPLLKAAADEDVPSNITPGGGAAATATAGAVTPAEGGLRAPSLGAPSAEAGQQQQQRRPLVLPCGHAFCEPCISMWLEQKKITCPICRKPFDDEDTPNGEPRGPPTQWPPAFRPPRDHQTPGAGGPTSSSASSFYGGAAGSSRPPCTVDDDEAEWTSPTAAAVDGIGSVSAPSSAAGGSGTSSGAGASRLRLRWNGGRRRQPGRLEEDLMIAEMLFRLRQLQRQHPDYISQNMLNTWEQDTRNGREFSVQQLRDFQLNDPVSRRALESSGQSGSSMSFGGGGSGGGGGRGGSW